MSKPSTQATFPDKPSVRPLTNGEYELTEDFVFPATLWDWRVVVKIRSGFRTDGASIPRLLWPLLGSPYDPDAFAAAIAHDALYRGEVGPRRDCDAAFRDMMRIAGVPWRRRFLMWLGVRLFGHYTTWRKHTRKSIEKARTYIKIAF